MPLPRAPLGSPLRNGHVTPPRGAASTLLRGQQCETQTLIVRKGKSSRRERRAGTRCDDRRRAGMRRAGTRRFGMRRIDMRRFEHFGAVLVPAPALRNGAYRPRSGLRSPKKRCLRLEILFSYWAGLTVSHLKIRKFVNS